MRKNRKGFTLFELFAVLSVIGTVLFIMFGSYGNWGASHAIRGAADILHAGLTEAQTLAMEHQMVSCFYYGNMQTNSNQTIPFFQTYLCFPTNGVESASEVEAEITARFDAEDPESLGRTFYFKPWTPRHRLPGKVRLARVRIAGKDTETKREEESTLFFRPNGTAFTARGSDHNNAHLMELSTREIYAPRIGEKAKPLIRLFRIDLESGEISEIDTKAGKVL